MDDAVSEDGGWEAARTEALSAPGGDGAQGGDGASVASSSYADLPAGVVLAGKYRIVGKLGSGGMGVVYEAFHAKLRQRIALKIPFSSKLSTTASARLFREARVAAGIDPSRTARVFDVGSLDDGTPFLVLEKLDGENLAQRLARTGRLSVADAAGFIAEACLGLAEVHRRGIVHRDIKPSNLFIAENPDGTSTLRILDFGIASVTRQDGEATTDASLTGTGSTLGSPPYMAPEQLRAASDVDARADVWALAVTLQQLLTDKLPFPGSGAALVAAIAADAPRAPRDAGVTLPADLEQLLARCLSKTPSKRPADAVALGRELARFVSPRLRGLIERQLGPGEPRRGRRRRSLVAAAAVALSVGSLAAVWGGRATPVASGETPVARLETPRAPTAPPPPTPEPPAPAPVASETVAPPLVARPPAVDHAPTRVDPPPPKRPVDATAPRMADVPRDPPPAPPVQATPDLLEAREF